MAREGKIYWGRGILRIGAGFVGEVYWNWGLWEGLRKNIRVHVGLGTEKKGERGGIIGRKKREAFSLRIDLLFDKTSNMSRLLIVSFLILHSLTTFAFTFLPHMQLNYHRIPSKLSSSPHRLRRGQGWSPSISPSLHQPLHSYLSSLDSSLPSPSSSSDDEYEEVELDFLTSSDFIDTEWKIGTLPRGSTKGEQIETTWVRLYAPEGDPRAFGGGKQKAQWGDGGKGTWNFDEAGQFLSVSKEVRARAKGWSKATATTYRQLT